MLQLLKDLLDVDAMCKLGKAKRQRALGIKRKDLRLKLCE
jgi:hypothetical protein